jgi:hypothetical protein
VVLVSNIRGGIAMTNENKHTPGPWELLEEMDGRHELMSSEGDWIATINTFSVVDEANARLIAAAPELLEALVIALPLVEASYLDHEGSANGDAIFGALEVIKAILAKAEGRG